MLRVTPAILGSAVLLAALIAACGGGAPTVRPTSSPGPPGATATPAATPPVDAAAAAAILEAEARGVFRPELGTGSYDCRIPFSSWHGRQPVFVSALCEVNAAAADAGWMVTLRLSWNCRDEPSAAPGCHPARLSYTWRIRVDESGEAELVSQVGDTPPWLRKVVGAAA